MNDFQRRQVALIGIMVVALLVAAASYFYSKFLFLPVAWPSPFYVNPMYWLPFLLFGIIGVFTVFRAEDHGWPWLVAVAGLWIFLIAFEDSIIQWFTIQQGVGTIGGRVNPIGITASVVAMGAAILLHVNQLGRQMRIGLAERGLDPRELRQVEEKSRALGRQTVVAIGGLVAVGSVILWIGGFALIRVRVGIGALGILGGLLILSVLAAMAYRVLRRGPVPGFEKEEIKNEPARRRPRTFR